MEIPIPEGSCFSVTPAELGPDCIRYRVPVLTIIALMAFAANSLLCR